MSALLATVHFASPEERSAFADAVDAWRYAMEVLPGRSPYHIGEVNFQHPDPTIEGLTATFEFVNPHVRKTPDTPVNPELE